MMKRRREWFLLVAVLTAACSSSSNTPPSSNDAEIDVGADIEDEAKPTDATTPDATAPDAESDATAPDAESDATAPDAESDATAPDAESDATAPDVTAPDVTAPDAGSDARVDAATDTSTDAGSDARVDAATDTNADAGSDARVDAATDTSADAHLDAASDVATDAQLDAATDSVADARPDGTTDVTDAASASGTTRDLWLLRVGDGTAALTNAATAIFIERRAGSDGTSRGAPLALPTAMNGANLPITLSGTATSEGSLTRSADGRFVTFAGYGATPGTAGVVASSVERVVARIAADGTIDTSTSLGMAYSANNVRGATTVNGSAFWVSGVGGIQYKTFGMPGDPINVLAAPSNLRVVGIFNGQLYASSATATPAPGFYGVFSVGMGTPTTTGTTATMLPGLPTTSGPSPYGFTALDLNASVPGVDTLYVCDDRSIASGGGLQRWTLASAGGMWTLADTVNTDITSGCRGLTAWTEGADVFIAIVTAETTSRVVLYRDRGGMPTAGPFVVAVAPRNTQFRGVALAPQ